MPTRADLLIEKYKEYADVHGNIRFNNGLIDGRGRDFFEEDRLENLEKEKKKLDSLADNGYLVGKILSQHLTNTLASVKGEVKQAFDDVLKGTDVPKKLTKKQQFELDVKNKSAERKLKSVVKLGKK
jgi:hypothetical protein